MPGDAARIMLISFSIFSTEIISSTWESICFKKLKLFLSSVLKALTLKAVEVEEVSQGSEEGWGVGVAWISFIKVIGNSVKTEGLATR